MHQQEGEGERAVPCISAMHQRHASVPCIRLPMHQCHASVPCISAMHQCHASGRPCIRRPCIRRPCIRRPMHQRHIVRAGSCLRCEASAVTDLLLTPPLTASSSSSSASSTICTIFFSDVFSVGLASFCSLPPYKSAALPAFCTGWLWRHWFPRGWHKGGGIWKRGSPPKKQKKERGGG